jgi:hypothetical protein
MSHTPHVHVGGHDNGKSAKTNRFELTAAVMLGIAGILIAVSGLESGMWNGKMSEHYSRSNKIATAAATEKSQALITMSKDTSVDVQAKQQMLEGKQNPAAEERTKAIAAYLYIFQMSDDGYWAMDFPNDLRDKVRAGDVSDETKKRIEEMLDDMLDADSEYDLGIHTEYQDRLLAKSRALSAEAETAFEEGVKANENGDRFELADVIFAISLFFTGISLIFRTKIRWAILSGGLLFLIGGIFYMALIPWTFS